LSLTSCRARMSPEDMAMVAVDIVSCSEVVGEVVIGVMSCSDMRRRHGGGCR
jgi:hypothetical protein